MNNAERARMEELEVISKIFGCEETKCKYRCSGIAYCEVSDYRFLHLSFQDYFSMLYYFVQCWILTT
jgi:hypothetical protein